MKSLLFGISLSFLVLVLFPRIALADLVNPDYFTKTCAPGEIEFECDYRSNTPFGPKIYDECTKYENNPNYTFLVGEGHSFGGSQKYCFKALSLGDSINYHITVLLPLILITLLLEIPLFLIMISKNRKALLTVLFANLISIPLLYFATTFLPFSGLVMLIVMELIVVIFEAIFIKLTLKELTFKKVLIYSFTANAVSAILGSIVLKIITGLIKI